MKKNVRLIVLLVIAVLILGAALIVVLNLPDQDDSGNTKTEKVTDLLLFDKTNFEPEEITVSNSSGEYSLYGLSYKDQISSEPGTESSGNERQDTVVETVKMIYTMSGYEDIDLSKSMTDQLAYQCSVLTALKVVDKSGKKYTDYGLDKPAATVKTVFSDNSTETVLIGKDAPDDQGVYCRYGKNVYLVQTDSVNMFLVNKLQMFDKTISDEFSELAGDDENAIAELSISGKAYDKPIEIDSKADIAISSRYKMRSPNHEICQQNIVNRVGKAVYGLSGSEVVAADMTADDLKKYGLDKPYISITAKSKDESVVSLAVSEADKDGNCYLMKKDGKLIFRFSTEDLKSWYGMKYKDFLSDLIVSPNVMNLTGIRTESNDNTTDIGIKNEVVINQLYEETIQTTATVNGKRVNYNNIDNLLNNISGLKRKSLDIESVEGWEKQADMVFSYEKDKEKFSDELAVYKSSKGEYAVTLNGLTECTVDENYAKLLIEQLSELKEDKEIKPIVADTEQTSEDSKEESSEQEKSEEVSG